LLRLFSDLKLPPAFFPFGIGLVGSPSEPSTCSSRPQEPVLIGHPVDASDVELGDLHEVVAEIHTG